MEDLAIWLFPISGLAFMVFWFIAWKRIFTKIGDESPGASAVAMFIPLLNIIVLFITSFKKWEIERELMELREEVEKLRKLKTVKELDEIKKEVE